MSFVDQIDWIDVRRRASIRASHYPQFDRDDLIQEASIAAWQAAQRFDPSRGGTLQGFIGYRAERAVLDHIRNSHLLPYTRAGVARLNPTSLDAIEGDDAGMSSGAFPVETLVLELDLRDEIRRIVNTLPDHLGVAITECVMNGRTLRSVGDEQGVTESAMCFRRSKALGLLRNNDQLKEVMTS